MEIALAQGGVVMEVRVKPGDMVKQGPVVRPLEAAGALAFKPIEASKQAAGQTTAEQDAPEKGSERFDDLKFSVGNR